MSDLETFILANFEKSNFSSIEGFPNPVQRSVMPVCSIKDESIRLVGTCFAITNHGLVLTARHVIEDALGITNDNLEGDGSGLVALYISEASDKNNPTNLTGGFLPVPKIYYSKPFDIAVMQVVLPVNIETNVPLRMPAMRLDALKPNINSNCTALGYHAMSCEKNDHAI